MMQNDYAGSCHCGAIGFTYRTAIDPARWSVRACQCSFCRAHDALSISDPAGEIAFTVSEPASLQKYRFGLRTADFLLCRECGVYIGALIETAGKAFGIVNLHAFQNAPKNLAAGAPVSYDAEDIEVRITRREQRWTPVVELPDSPSPR